MGAGQSVPSLLTCAVCRETYSDPCTLDCGHTFCRGCIYKYLEDNDKMGKTCLACPLCEETTVLAVPGKTLARWVEELKPNIIVSGLIKDISGVEVSDIYTCSLCRDKKPKAAGNFWCHVCDMAMCDNCHKTHSRIPSSRDHGVSKINQDLKVRCQKHPKYPIEWICQICDVPICTVCKDIEHRKCDEVVSLESLKPEMESKLMTRSEKLTQTIDDLTNEINGKRTLIKENQTEADKNIVAITQTCEQARRLITQREVLLKQELKDKTEEEVKKIQDQIKSRELELQTQQQHMAYIELLKRNQEPLEFYNLLSRVREGAQSPRRFQEEPLLKIQLKTSQEKLESSLPEWIRLESTNI